MKLLLTVAALCIVILLLVARRINSKENWSQPHCFGDKADSCKRMVHRPLQTVRVFQRMHANDE